MHKLWLQSVRGYLRLGMFFYFKKIEVNNVNNVPKNQSLLILCNHQNALLDALLIGITCGRFVHFLTRASVFKNPVVERFLKSLQMLPVYRIRDGWNNISKNNSIFSICSKFLGENEAIVIFPEGSHNLKRTVRPFSKGFTRIVFETLERSPKTNLKLLPVGLNYIKPTKFGDSVAIYYGETIEANEYNHDFDNKNVEKLKWTIRESICNLTTHIPEETYDETLHKLERLQVDFLNPTAINECMASNFESCQFKPKKDSIWVNLFFKTLLKIVLIGPYLIWKYVVTPKIAEPEFKSTFRFAIALTLVPIWLVIISSLLCVSLGWTVALGFIATVLVIDLLAVKI